MSVFEYKVPKPVSLVGDPVIVEAMTVLGNATRTVVNIVFFNGHDGGYFKILFLDDNTEVRFDYTYSLTKITDVLPRDNFVSIEDWAAHVADRMSVVYEVASRFTVEHFSGSNPVRLTSKEYININIDIDDGEPTLPFVYIDSYTHGHPLNLGDGYMMGIRVYDDNYKLIGELAEYPTNDGKVSFNISEFLEILPNPALDLESGILSYTDVCMPYQYQLYDKVGFPAVEGTPIYSDTYYAIYGKSSYMKGAKWNEELGSFYNEIIINKSFLNLQPNNKKISPFAPELLSFLIFDETISTVKLHLTVNFTDGSSQEIDKATIGATYGKVLQLNITPELLDLFEIDENKTVDNFAVVLRNQSDTDISQERTYIIDYETYDYLRFFIFRNDYGGGYDCMRSTGEVSNPAKISKEFGTSTLPYDYTTKDRYETQVSAKRIMEFKLNWGLMKKNGGDARDWKNYIQQVEMSYDVYEYINNITVPCNFITDSYNLHDDNRRIYTHTSVYRRAFVDEAYSDDDIPITGDYSDDFNDDYFN